MDNCSDGGYFQTSHSVVCPYFGHCGMMERTLKKTMVIMKTLMGVLMIIIMGVLKIIILGVLIIFMGVLKIITTLVSFSPLPFLVSSSPFAHFSSSFL